MQRLDWLRWYGLLFAAAPSASWPRPKHWRHLDTKSDANVEVEWAENEATEGGRPAQDPLRAHGSPGLVVITARSVEQTMLDWSTKVGFCAIDDLHHGTGTEHNLFHSASSCFARPYARSSHLPSHRRLGTAPISCGLQPSTLGPVPKSPQIGWISIDVHPQRPRPLIVFLPFRSSWRFMGAGEANPTSLPSYRG
jgi:hypothetical protein